MLITPCERNSADAPGCPDVNVRSSLVTPVLDEAAFLLDRILLVLILMEIVHPMALSLRAHRLIAQPVIVVWLVAVRGEFSSCLHPAVREKRTAAPLAWPCSGQWSRSPLRT